MQKRAMPRTKVVNPSRTVVAFQENTEVGVNGFHSKMQLDVSDELVEEIVVSEHAIDVAAHGRDSTTLFFLIPMNVPSVSAYSVVADTDFLVGVF